MRLWISYTYDFSRGWTLVSHSGMLSAAVVDASGREPFPLFGDSASGDEEAILFFPPPAGGLSSSASSYSSSEEGWLLESSDFAFEAFR